MDIKTNPTKVIRSACALSLAGIMMASSVISVASAATISSVDESIATSTSDSLFAQKLTQTLPSDDNKLVIGAFHVTIERNGSIASLLADEGLTVEEALDRAGVTLSDNQVGSIALDYRIEKNLNIKIFQAKKITVTADGKSEKVLLALGNVWDSLNIAGYRLSDDDILSVDADSNVEDINKVTIKRVTYKTKDSEKTISFDSKTEMSDDLELGINKVKTEGKNGLKEITTQYKYVDGKEADSEIVDEKIIKKAVDKVTLVGTKGSKLKNVAGTFTDSNGVTVAYSQVLSGSGTAYTAPAGAGTATGVPAYHGGVAVNPGIIPYGSKLYIESTDGSFVYGYATAVDTGGALMAGTAIVDCFYDTYDECVNFGRRNVNVYIVG